MRLVRTLTLAGFAAVVILTSIGTGTAAADVLCLVHAVPCPAPQVEPNGTVIRADSNKIGEEQPEPDKVTLLAGSLETQCYSSLEGKTTGSLGNHNGLSGVLEQLTFSDCEGACTGVKENEAENLPYTIIALALFPNEKEFLERLKGRLHIYSENPGSHEISVLMTGCPLGISCLYGTNAMVGEVLSHKPANGTSLLVLKPMTIHIKEKVLRSGHSALCPSEATFDALYHVTEPTGLLALSPE